MSDKDLLVVISEMLRKQDQQAEILNEHTKIINETNNNLNEFIELSTKEFQGQYKFNNKFELEFVKQKEFNEEQKQFNEEQKHFNEEQKHFNNKFELEFEKQKQFNEEQKQFNDEQRKFNERLMNKLDDIEKAVKK
jgi:hypothetical protein